MSYTVNITAQAENDLRAIFSHIAFEGQNGRVSTRPIVPFLKKVEHILSSDPEKVIHRINGKVMRVHAYEWNQMKDDYLVVPLGKLKERNKPYGNDPKTQKLVDCLLQQFSVYQIASE